ncbi:MAG: glycosyltransferase [Methylothermaceae bacterium]|nr:glycosyltransferase [Methylothermaceae bacterium]
MLKPFALDTVLMLYLQCEQKKLKGLRVLLNNQTLPGPLLGIQLHNENEYFLVSDYNDLPSIETRELEVLDGNGHRIAMTRTESLTPLGERDIEAFSSLSRSRIRKGLLEKVPQQFPHIPAATLYKLASALAVKQVYAEQWPACGTYFRLPYASIGSAHRIPGGTATLFQMARQGLEELGKIPVAADRGWLHGLIALSNVEFGDTQAVFVLDIRELGPIPFILIDAKRLPNREIASANDIKAIKDYLRRQSSPALGGGAYAGDFWINREGRLSGWVNAHGRLASPVELEVRADAIVVERIGTDASLEKLGGDKVPSSNCEFCFDLPDWVFDGNNHCLTVSVVEGEKRVLITKPLYVKARYFARLTAVTPRRFAGSIINRIAPARPVALDFVINGKIVDTARAVIDPNPNTNAKGEAPAVQQPIFDFEIPGECLAESGITLSLFVSGTRTQVFGSKAVITPYDLAMRSLMTAAERLNDMHPRQGLARQRVSGGLEVNSDLSYWFRSQVIARAIAEIRKNKKFPKSVTIPLSAVFTHPRASNRESVIDVIIPVYKGFEQTLKCIQTVLEGSRTASYQLIVVNDKSPDLRLMETLRGMAASGVLTLLENEENLGFVRSVNRAMKLHPERDVVLLNSDTEVPSGWLDRLQRAAYSRTNIGTATPFSNNATICSFPKSCANHGLPPGMHLAEIDRLFQSHNHRKTVDLPTGIGFCMYIKRDVLEEIGYFDEGRWGAGYGEENDFCLRAAALGWRHVAACDLFVLHHGAVSFGVDSERLIAKNLEKLTDDYPDYSNTVNRFILQDPLRHARNRVSKALLQAHAGQYMLFVMHAMGGGTQVAADELAARLGLEEIAVLQLTAKADGRWELYCFESPFLLTYQYPEDWEQVVRDLKDLQVWHVHYHQTMHFSSSIWTLPEYLDVPYDFTAHDYLPVCPRINMIDETGYYCGDSSLSADTCNRCIAYNGPEPGLEDKYEAFGGDIKQWRFHYARYLKGARKVFFPSEDTARRYQRYFKLENSEVRPHPEEKYESFPLTPILHKSAYAIAVIGAIGYHKGYRLLRDCARSALKEGLPLRFVVIGYTCDDAELAKQANVVISGRYEREQLPDLIKHHRCAMALFLSPWPETYSYTLSEAWRAGLYPLALDIGAIAERIKQSGYGEVMPLTSHAKQINRRLMCVAAHFERPETKLSFASGPRIILREYYGLAVNG